MSNRIVIIGGVATGPKAASRARRRDPNAEITIIEKGNLLSYAGCGMPYFIVGDVKNCDELMCTPAGVVRNSTFFQNVKDIKAYTKTLAQAIDREKKEVKVIDLLSNESRTIPYDKLVIATGSTHFRPPIEGSELNRIYTLGHPDEAIAIQQCANLEDVKSVAVFGGGLIGMEVTEAFVRLGLEVTVVEMIDRLLPKLLDAEISAYLAKYLRSQGIKLRLSEKAIKLEGDENNNVRKVITDKSEISADMIVTAIGVRPNVELAKNAGLKIGETGAIWVDEYLRTSDPDIYAGGDCVENTHLVTGKKVYVPLGSTANKHGRIIGDNVTGGSEKFNGVLGTTIFKILDYTVGCTGLTERYARELGYNVVTCIAPGSDVAHYYPESALILIKLVVNKDNGKILGAQMIGPGDIDKRLDVVATTMTYGGTVRELANTDLGYAPPYSSAIDMVAHAANIIRNKIDGIAKSITPMEVKAKMDAGEDFILLDVRTPAELIKNKIDDPRVKYIPLGALRSRANELPKDKEIIAFCAISLRGYEAQTILDGLGFTNVKFMDGGLAAWTY
ncbi:TPA: pyridine nucleotide-disulfide oxidoreductase [Candidatus Poribacteria bacterium]|nr:pyridine nucleotide-disulfide oxidoreductase [Candidatus Poribacteria bacterium]